MFRIAVLSICLVWLWQSGALAKLPPPQTAYSPDGALVAVTDAQSTPPGIRLYEGRTLREQGVLQEQRGIMYDMAFSPDGQTLASVGNYGVHLWDVEQRAMRAILNIDKGSAIAFHPNSPIFALGGWDSTLRLWDLSQPQEIAVMKGHISYVYSVAFSPDGQTLASGSLDKTVRLWDVAQQREIGVLKGHTAGVGQVIFSPDGQTLASASGDGTVCLWSVATQQETAVLQHPTGVSSVDVSPDGRLLASVGWDGLVHLWEVMPPKERGVLKGPTIRGGSVAFSPDGKALVGAGWDSELQTNVVLWEVETRPTVVPTTSWGRVKHLVGR